MKPVVIPVVLQWKISAAGRHVEAKLVDNSTILILTDERVGGTFIDFILIEEMQFGELSPKCGGCRRAERTKIQMLHHQQTT